MHPNLNYKIYYLHDLILENFINDVFFQWMSL